MLGEPCLETSSDSLRLRHSADTGGMLHHPFAFRDRELTEQEEAFAWSGGDPVGVAAAGIEECRLRRAGGLLGELDQLIFNLERSQRLEFTELHNVNVFPLLKNLQKRRMIAPIPQIEKGFLLI